jgi:hypothetical protein
LAAAKLDVDRRGVDGQTGGKAVDQGDDRLAVGFAGGQVTQHGAAE